MRHWKNWTKINGWSSHSRFFNNTAMKRSPRSRVFPSLSSRRISTGPKPKCVVEFAPIWRQTMRCEEYLPLIEDYLEGELDEQASHRLTSHLAVCGTCSDEYRQQ